MNWSLFYKADPCADQWPIYGAMFVIARRHTLGKTRGRDGMDPFTMSSRTTLLEFVILALVNLKLCWVRDPGSKCGNAPQEDRAQ